MTLQSNLRDDVVLAGGLPIARSQPEFLAAIGKIRGMQPRQVDRASVLEIACGDGGNLIPLAERYPHTTYLGIDDSARNVAAAEAEARDLGLENIAFRQTTALEIDDDAATFDYIIAAGVYSRVDAAAREKLLALCQRHLAPQGIAYVDYKAYPGWHEREVLRSMMRYHARKARTAAARLAAGRTLLEFVRASLPAEDGGYGSRLSGLANAILEEPDESIYRDYLHDESHAVEFEQFVEHARHHALQILGDAAAGVLMSEFLSVDLEHDLHAVTDDQVDKEAFRDLLHCTAHRQSLLCHETIGIHRGPATERMRGLYLDARLRMEDLTAPLQSHGKSTFTVPNGLTVSSRVPVIKMALNHLGTIWPGTIEFEELVRVACEQARAADETDDDDESQPIAPADVQRVEHNLMQCCSTGIIQVHGARGAFVTAFGERPTAGPLARRQAASDKAITNRRHESVQLPAFDRHVLALLDGTRSVADIVDHLSAAAEAGRIGLVEEGQPVPPERATGFIEEQLTATLLRLAENALLIA